MATFRRGDGIVFEADEGSESFTLMAKDGNFTRTDETAAPAADETPKPETAAAEAPAPKAKKAK